MTIWFWLEHLTLEQACLLVIAASAGGLFALRAGPLLAAAWRGVRRRTRRFRWRMRQPDSVPNRVRGYVRGRTCR